MSTGTPNGYNIVLGNELRNLRLKADFCQQDIVNLSNGELRMGTVIALENAKYNVGIRQFATYVDLLGYKISIVEK